MKTAEKIFSFLYNLMGWCTWLGVIALLVFTTYLFVTGDSRSPDIGVTDITVTEELSDDATLKSAGISDSPDLFRVDYRVHIEGAKLSPYTFSAKGIKLKTDTLPAAAKYITIGGDEITDGEIRYSKLSPADFTVSVYVSKKNATAEEIAAIAPSAGFTLTDMELHFALLDIAVTGGTPSFYADGR